MNYRGMFQKLWAIMYYVASVEGYFDALYFEDHSQQIALSDHVHFLFFSRIKPTTSILIVFKFVLKNCARLPNQP